MLTSGWLGAPGDYFAPNSVNAPWWPAARRSRRPTNSNTAAMTNNGIRPLALITDGLSNTLLLSELAGRPDSWIKGVKQASNANLRFPNWWGPWASYQCCDYDTWSDDGTTVGGNLHHQLQQLLGHLLLSFQRRQCRVRGRLGPFPGGRFESGHFRCPHYAGRWGIAWQQRVLNWVQALSLRNGGDVS